MRKSESIALALAGMTGIVTAHDLIEALVGSLPEEESKEPPAICELGERVWKISGDTELDDIGYVFNVNLKEFHCDTINGFMYEILERISEDGETIEGTYKNMNIHVLEVRKHCIAEARVCIADE